MSYAVRLKVGSVLVKGDNIISYGWNGMPAGWDNNCEYREYPPKFGIGNGEYNDFGYDLIDEDGKMYRLVTRPEVLHSEANCISKIAKSNESSDGATLFCTHAPCLDCAKLIHQAGINSVYYRTAYRSTDGITFLEKSGITVNQH
jgi:dCMP deaminase